MITYKTRDELERSGLELFPRIVQNKVLHDHIFADPSHPEWQGCGFSTIQHLAQRRAEGCDISDAPVWQRVVDIEDELWCQLSHFKPRKEDKLRGGIPYTYYSYDLLLSTQKNKRKNAKERAMRLKNERVRAFYMMGDPDAPLICPIEKTNIGIARRFRNKNQLGLADGHHLVCNGRESTMKEGQDPGKLNSTVDLLNAKDPRARFVIDDLMALTLVSKGGHACIHNYDQSDIDSYDDHELPWIYRTEDNYYTFTAFLESHGHDYFRSYEDQKKRLTLGYHGITKGPDYMTPDSILD